MVALAHGQPVNHALAHWRSLQLLVLSLPHNKMSSRATQCRCVLPLLLDDAVPNTNASVAAAKAERVFDGIEAKAVNAASDGPDTSISTATSGIDHSAFPHLIRCILAFSDPPELRMWRQTSKAMQAVADAELARPMTVRIGATNQVHFECGWAGVPASLNPYDGMPASLVEVMGLARSVVLYADEVEARWSPPRRLWLEGLEGVFAGMFPNVGVVRIGPNAVNAAYTDDPPIKARDICVTTWFVPGDAYAAVAFAPGLFRHSMIVNGGTMRNDTVRRYIVNVEIDPTVVWLARAVVTIDPIPPNCDTVVIFSEKTPPGVKPGTRRETYKKAKSPMGLCTHLAHNAIRRYIAHELCPRSITLVGLNELDPRWLGLDAPYLGHTPRPDESPAQAIERCFLDAIVRDPQPSQFVDSDVANNMISFLTHAQYIDRVGARVYASQTDAGGRAPETVCNVS